MGKAVLNVAGMKCGGCEKSVQDIAQSLAGVLSAKASSKEATLEVDYDEEKVSLDSIKHLLPSKGYGVV